MAKKEAADSLKVEDAVNIISDANYGVHYLVIYPDLLTLREFYSYYVHKNVEECNEVVQLAFFYENEDNIRQRLSESHRAINVEKLERDKSLVITDSLKKYFADKQNVKSDWNANRRMVSLAKSMGKRGYSILGDIGAFVYENRINELVDYELFLPHQYNIDMKGICLYHKNDFDQLSEDQKSRLVEHHGKVF